MVKAIKRKEQKKPPKKLKKQKAKYVEKTGILGRGEDYHVYHMSMQEKLTGFAIGFAVGAIIFFAFYSNLIGTLICGLICGAIGPKYYKKYCMKKRMDEFRLQFKDALESIASSYSAGMNTTHAFRDAYKDLSAIYGENSDICQEIGIVCMGLESNFSIEQMLRDWADRCGLEDVQSFADVFEVCNRSGSNLKKIVSDTRDIINDKIEMEMEIKTILASNKNELSIMAVMPLIIVLALRFMGGNTVTSNTPQNIAIKTVCLAMFVGAYVAGMKITDIKI